MSARRALLLPPSIALLCLFSACGRGPEPIVHATTAPRAGATPSVERGPAIARRAEVAVPTEVAELVPADAFLFAQVRSLDELESDLARLRAVLPDGLPQGTLRQAIGAQLPINATLIDGTRPLGLALTLAEDPEAEPDAVAILPVSDVEAFLRGLETSGPRPAGRGDWVAVPLGSSYAPAETPVALARTVPAGDLAVNVDLKRLLEAFGGEIDAGLAMMRSDMSSAPMAPGIDTAAFADAWSNQMRELLDAAEGISFAVDLDGTAVGLFGAFTAAEGSALVEGWAGAPADPGRLAGYLPEEHPVAMAAAWDLVGGARRSAPFFGDLLSQLDPALHAQVEDTTTALEQLYEGFGDEVAISAGVADGALEFSYFFEVPRAAELLPRYARALEGVVLSAEGVTWEGPFEAMVADVPVVQYRVRLDSDWEPTDGSLTADEVAALGDALRALHGEDGMRITAAGYGDVLALVVGGDDAVDRAVTALSRGPGEEREGLSEAAEEVRGANPSFVLHIDLRSALRQVSALVAGAEGLPLLPPDVLEGAPVPIVLYGALDGRTWYGGLAVDVARARVLAESIFGS
jgi:hypothetical protein